MAKRLNVIAVMSVAVVLSASASWDGQTVGTATGSIIGTAKDATGAVLSRVGMAISGSGASGLPVRSVIAGEG